jgi:plastocyanin
MNNTRRRLAIATACLLTFAMAACSSDSKSSPGSSASSGNAAPAALTIQSSSFSVANVTAGTAFTISNKDGVTHTVTDDGGTFNVRVPGGGTETLTIPKAGTYKIHCEIHASMHGTITVT